METPALLAAVLRTAAATDCRIDPEGSPPGALIRVLYSAPFLANDEAGNQYGNTQPEAIARTGDVASVVPEVTRLRITDAGDFIAERLEPVAGSNAWRQLLLRNAPEV